MIFFSIDSLLQFFLLSAISLQLLISSNIFTFFLTASFHLFVGLLWDSFPFRGCIHFFFLWSCILCTYPAFCSLLSHIIISKLPSFSKFLKFIIVLILYSPYTILKNESKYPLYYIFPSNLFTFSVAFCHKVQVPFPYRKLIEF